MIGRKVPRLAGPEAFLVYSSVEVSLRARHRAEILREDRLVPQHKVLRHGTDGGKDITLMEHCDMNRIAVFRLKSRTSSIKLPRGREQISLICAIEPPEHCFYKSNTSLHCRFLASKHKSVVRDVHSTTPIFRLRSRKWKLTGQKHNTSRISVNLPWMIE